VHITKSVKGNWQRQGYAASVVASLRYQQDDYTIDTEDGQRFRGILSEVDISPRLARIERKLTLPDGSVFSTRDNDGVDQLSKSANGGFIHILESKLRWVMVALVVTVFCGFSFVKWGIPWASTQIAYALPHKTNELIASNTLAFLDDYFFDDSQLDATKQQQIRAHFESVLVPLEENTEITYKLHFRAWNQGDEAIPNAFALPSGDIVLTDKFVELSKNQQEIDSVLLHEMGHVIRRHGLQRVIEGTFVTVALTLITGDISALAGTGLGLGTLLVSNHYSRGHESEADEYAFKKMLLMGDDPDNFANIMARITNHAETLPEYATTTDEADSDQQRGDVLDYLSTHPRTEKRIEQAKRYSQCFKEGLIHCEINH
jgi:Zn-dependent protease with chaperone function